MLLDEMVMVLSALMYITILFFPLHSLNDIKIQKYDCNNSDRFLRVLGHGRFLSI